MTSWEATDSYLVLLSIQELSLEPKMNCQCDLLDEMAMRIGGLKPNRDDPQPMSQNLFAPLPFFALRGHGLYDDAFLVDHF